MLHCKLFLFLSCTDCIPDFASWQVEDFSTVLNLTQMRIHFFSNANELQLFGGKCFLEF